MSEREEWMALIRNEYDPKPDLGRASYPAFDSEWDDGAGRIADAIVADKTLLLRKLNDAIGHLGGALMQIIASDDQIIIGHVRDAHEILKTIARR